MDVGGLLQSTEYTALAGQIQKQIKREVDQQRSPGFIKPLSLQGNSGWLQSNKKETQKSNTSVSSAYVVLRHFRVPSSGAKVGNKLFSSGGIFW